MDRERQSAPYHHRGGGVAELTLVEAVNLALAHEMQRDPDVLLLGEDIGVNGGVFRATNGLIARFGRERVVDTPPLTPMSSPSSSTPAWRSAWRPWD